MANSNFKQLGNLAFYDGWSPNYVYFNTLQSMVDEEALNKKQWGGIDRGKAAEIAQAAINDAQQYQNLHGLNPEEANDAITERMQRVINFLQSAISYEEGNELKYFEKKFIEINKTFTKEEIAVIKPLNELVQSLKDHNSTEYYQKYITLINVLMSGLNNTKTIARHEAKRIQEIDDAVEGIISRHKDQVTGLFGTRYAGRTDKNGKPYDLNKMLKNSEENLRKNVKIQYLGHGNLTSGTYKERTIHHKNGQTTLEKKTHFLLGSKSAFSKIEHTIDVELGKWATTAIKKAIKDPTLLRRMVKAIQGKYPADADFSLLEADVKQAIILTIQQYGLKDLSKVISKTATQKECKQIVNEIVKDDLFELTDSYRYKISGLYLNYGQYGRTSKFFDDIRNGKDKYEASAAELYNAISKLISQINSKNIGLTPEQEYLIDVFKKNDSWNQAEEMDRLIKTIEKLQKKLKRLNEQHSVNDLSEKELEETEFNLGKDKNGEDIIITFSIVDDKVEINTENASIASQISKMSNFDQFGFKGFNSRNLSSIVATLKKRASLNLRDNLADSLSKIIENEFDVDEETILQKVQAGLENMHISISGPKVSELAAGINFFMQGDNLIVDWAGGLNGKNDVIVVSIDDITQTIKLDLNMGQRMKDAILNNITPELETARNNFLEEWNQQLRKTIGTANSKRYAKKYTHIARSFLRNAASRDNWDKQLQDKYRALQDAWTKQKAALKKAGVSERKIEEIKMRFLNSLASSFYVSTTVKTYDTYLNNMGFVGGSLGGNLDSQLTRLANLFKLSGLSIDADFKWLKSAIINCSPLTIAGESNKNLIENYLGSMAAFALFDEGGAEGKLISNYMNDLQKFKATKVNPDILHLYRVNGIYVPGSYVLRQVYNALTGTVMPLIESIDNTMRAGATVEIINGASLSMIPNRPIAQTSRPKTSAWTLVGREVAANTHIQILFLAGLLDIANSINKELGNIELPA